MVHKEDRAARIALSLACLLQSLVAVMLSESAPGAHAPPKHLCGPRKAIEIASYALTPRSVRGWSGPRAAFMRALQAPQTALALAWRIVFMTTAIMITPVMGHSEPPGPFRIRTARCAHQDHDMRTSARAGSVHDEHCGQSQDRCKRTCRVGRWPARVGAILPWAVTTCSGATWLVFALAQGVRAGIAATCVCRSRDARPVQWFNSGGSAEAAPLTPASPAASNRRVPREGGGSTAPTCLPRRSRVAERTRGRPCERANPVSRALR